MDATFETGSIINNHNTDMNTMNTGKILTSIFTSLILLLTCSHCFAETAASTEILKKCKAPSPPSIPNGNRASEEEMVEAQGKLKAYIAEGDNYLACLQEIEITWGPEATDEQKTVLTIYHNSVVESMQNSADLFNSALRVYKSRQ